MGIEIGSNSFYAINAGMNQGKVKTDPLLETLKSNSASDEELMEACKSFESYMLEQVFKGMEKTIIKDEEKENDYMAQFGDRLYEEYAKSVTDNQSLGLAQMLYESMKRNQAMEIAPK